MRKNYIQVENMTFLRLSNAEFISFMERFMALLPLEDDEEGGQHAPKLGITAELVAEGKAFLASMNDLTLKSQLKAETKPKKEIDRLRDRMLAYIIERIDFSVQALGIENDLDTLQTYNDQFEALVKEADVKSSSLDMSEKMRDLRVQMGDWYQEVTSLAFASNVLNESEESLSFLTGLNAVIQDVKTLYKQRIAQLNSGKEETSKPEGEGDDKGDGNLEFVPVE